MDLQRLARALGGEVNSGQVLAPGPGHSPKDRSLSVKLSADAPDGFVVNSFAGDDPITCKDYVRSKAGIESFKPNGKRKPAFDIGKVIAAQKSGSTVPRGKIVAEYNYADATGALLYQVVRFDPKDFRQRRPDGKGGWIWNLDGLDERRVLYRLRELGQYPDASVFLCEGEKDADRVASLGHCATTVAGGKWTAGRVKALSGRDVLILEDNDEAGRTRPTRPRQRFMAPQRLCVSCSCRTYPKKATSPTGWTLTRTTPTSCRIFASVLHYGRPRPAWKRRRRKKQKPKNRRSCSRSSISVSGGSTTCRSGNGPC